MEFIKPNAAFLDEYLAACKESHEHNITEWMPVKLENFEGWKESALLIYDMLDRGERLPVGVPRTSTYWCVEDKRFVGEVQLRPYISADESKTAGHIGYAVRYSMWGNGFGTKLLQFAIEKLREYHVSPIFVACHIDNIASNRLCQKIGFQFVETRTTDCETENVYMLR